jgi:uncharacterized membrane protein
MSRRSWQALTLLPATLAAGYVTGVFGDWATTVMPALGKTDDRTYIAVLQDLNHAIIYNPFFMPAFMAGLVLTGIAAVLFLRDGGGTHPALPWVAVAFGLQLAGTFITMGVHEPLNEIIRGAGDPANITDPTALRDSFHETRWVVWHAIRTAATAAAFGCLAWALVLHGRVDAAATPGPTSHDQATTRPATSTNR